MNDLYALLTYKQPTGDGSYYVKRHTQAKHTYASTEIADAITAHVPDNRICMFACVLCNAVLFTRFKADILAYDKNNTYTPVKRPPSVLGDDSSCCMHDLCLTDTEMHSLLKYVDKDILDRITVHTWLDDMAALCLQMLRESAINAG